jgi:hypothetical protein
MLNKITLNLGGLKMTYRYNQDFSMLQAKLSDGTWMDFSFAIAGCGLALTKQDIITTIRHKISLN